MSNPEDLIRDEIEYPAQTQQLQKHYMRSQDDQRSLLRIRTRLLEQRALQHSDEPVSAEKSQPIPLTDSPNEQFERPEVGQFHQPPIMPPSRKRRKTMRTWAALIAVLCIAVLGSLWYALLQLPGQTGHPVKPQKTPQPNSSTHINAVSAITMTSTSSGWGRVLTDQGNTITIARTTDGGKTWQPFNFNYQLAGMLGTSFLDDQTAWVVLDLGGYTNAYDVMHTTDGGKHWTKLQLPPGVTDITFVDHQHGWAWYPTPHSQKSLRTIYATTDGGATWHSVNVMDTNRQPGAAGTPGPLPFDALLNLNFATPQHGWAILGESLSSPHEYLYQTHDGGKTWALQQLPQPASGPIPGIHVPMQEDTGARIVLETPQFFTPQQGMLTIISQINKQSPHEMYLYSTNDGGQSWSPLGNKIEKTSQSSNNLLVLDTTHLLLIDGKTVTRYALIDNQWQPQHTTTMKDNILYASTTGKQAWISTEKLSGNHVIDTLYTSNDMGNSWQQVMQNN